MSIRVRRRNPFHFSTPRQRLLILGVAVAAATALSLGLLLAHVRVQKIAQVRTPPLPCTPARDGNCIGAPIEVMLLAPAPSAASAPR
jgi:hypothetical protein